MARQQSSAVPEKEVSNSAEIVAALSVRSCWSPIITSAPLVRRPDDSVGTAKGVGTAKDVVRPTNKDEN
jgi:hypothetical protein